MTNQVNASVVAAPKKKKKIPSLDRKKSRAGWLFVLPFLIGLVFIYLPIIWESFSYSFYNYTSVKGIVTKEFAGFQHYTTAFTGDAAFAQALLTGLKEMAFDIPAILIFSLFVAVILNQKMIGRAAFRAIFFLPVIVSTGVMESVMSSSYGASGDEMDLGMEGGEEAVEELATSTAFEALLISIFQNLGFGTGLVTYISSAVASISGIINRSGVQILIFLAALQSISPAIYESCQIDGATSWETFWKITFPMVSPMILVNAVYTIIDSFTTDSNSVMQLINNTYMGVSAGAKSVSAAMGWMYFLVVLAIVGIVAGIFSMYVFYQRRD
ncbi:MAG: sugar ABC transporter permease [Clostridia bacterium]|nr:sugar ABC transporter permease [Oscillospiraceae bacterium]MBQ3056181.1 sugar ABC transporter permease [Clostridia bacterium]